MAVCVRAGESAAPASKPAVAEVSVDASKAREPISPYIYGQFIEHLGRCIYGGIWAEMLEDRKFYFPVPADTEIWRLTREQARVLAASPWKVAGPQGTVEMVKQDAFVGDHSPQINAPGAGTAVGIYQEELGLVKGRAYVGYLYVAAEGKVAPVTDQSVLGPGRCGQGRAHDQVGRRQVYQGCLQVHRRSRQRQWQAGDHDRRQGQAQDRLRVPDAGRQRGGLSQGHSRAAPAAQRPGVSVAGRQLRERL